MRNIIPIILLLICLKSFSEENLFKQANDLYSNAEYLEAINLYDSILDKKLESPELYYNLGNSYYKLSDWTNAIYYYEKSNKLKSSKETEDNLKLANTKIFDNGKIASIPDFVYQKWWKKIQRILNTKNWQYLTIVSVWIFFLLWILDRFFKKKTKRIARIFLSLSLICFIFSFSSYRLERTLKEAIIFDSEAIVSSSPATDGVEKFVIHSGTKVKIKEKINSWVKIEIANGKSGWILANSCREI